MGRKETVVKTSSMYVFFEIINICVKRIFKDHKKEEKRCILKQQQVIGRNQRATKYYHSDYITVSYIYIPLPPPSTSTSEYVSEITVVQWYYNILLYMVHITLCLRKKIVICMKKGCILSLSDFVMLLKFEECMWWFVFLFLS